MNMNTSLFENSFREKMYEDREYALPKEYFKRDTETALKWHWNGTAQCRFSAISVSLLKYSFGRAVSGVLFEAEN